MYNTPRAATIIATEEGALWGLVSENWNETTQPEGRKKKHGTKKTLESTGTKYLDVTL